MTFDSLTSDAVGVHSTTATSFDDRKPVFQKTLKTSIGCTGIGLHTGVRVAMKLHPAPPNTGIVFRRVDLVGGGATIKASWAQVVDSRMCTVLADENGISVATVEHLMSALYGLEVDNVVVELNGPEVPAMDGSAAPFIFLMECAGLVEQDAPRRAMRILKQHSYVKEELSRARTFGLLSDVTALREAGLARGGSLANAIVVDGNRILNEDGLRHDDEFVRHKALDAVGDLYLTGYPIVGHFIGRCSSHADTARLMHQVYADPTCWEMVDLWQRPADTASWLNKAGMAARAAVSERRTAVVG
jgi:UDP-3-O-[3-hydroxymyristoyl] N-acetylglucosamine deacetylase